MSSKSGKPPVKLSAVLDLQAASDLAEELKGQLQGDGTAVLDASDVEVLTLPCIQVIMAAAEDGQIGLMTPSDEFLNAFRDLALQPPALVAAAEPAPIVVADAPPLVQDAPVAQPEAPAAPAPAAAAPARAPGAPQRILTIDDSKTMRDMLRLTLIGAGYEVLQGVDGQDGIEVLGDQMVDAVITDINMPRMDGYEVIRELRKQPRLDKTPILVLTTESEKDKRDIARQSGATGWMVKPFDPEKLVATLRKVLPLNAEEHA